MARKSSRKVAKKAVKARKASKPQTAKRKRKKAILRKGSGTGSTGPRTK